ncbi:response regulator transcription factor [Azospirillum agricola]|uniref:response regulator transcription factor n=1 Tax=Azospirillum agricola TaxID=1720247 RepID=UPI000A0F06E3|nr:response regulator transcription factor [Azospirillum agricola]SMH47483.1 two-component system, OmpR family, response regulator ChvI [Azospirillum lipoferum]
MTTATITDLSSFAAAPSANTSTARMAEAIARVALVDADDRFREALGTTLADQGYDVRLFDRSGPALDYLANGGQTDIVLLDWNIPGTDTAAILRDARDRGLSAPVICLADKVHDAAEEMALANGAVDFVEKTRRLPILLRRMALAMDSTRGLVAYGDAPAETGPAMQVIGDLELRLDQSRALWKGQRLDLTLTEFNMVKLMATRPDADVSYREIYDLVHGPGFMAGHGGQGFRANVRAFIKRIRQKFRAIDAEFDSIGNYPGFGYRWTSETADALQAEAA